MTARRVLVTGAGGFVGGALADGFAALGCDVVAIDRDFDASPPTDRVHRRAADLAMGMPPAVGAVDLVVHAAWLTGAPDATPGSAAEYAEANLAPLRSVLEWVGRTAPSAFVFLSSSGVFAGDDASDFLTDTDTPTSDTPYARAKRDGEALVAATTSDTAMHVVRLGYLYGPGEAARPSRPRVSWVARWIADARAGRPLEVWAGDARREWTCTLDLAPALLRLVGGPAADGPIHLCSPYVYLDRAMATAVCDAFGRGVLTAVPAEGPLKAPMAVSDVAALRGFPWRHPDDALRAMAATEAVAGESAR